MFIDAFNAIKGVLGNTISSAIEAILNATLFRLLYFLEIGLEFEGLYFYVYAFLFLFYLLIS